MPQNKIFIRLGRFIGIERRLKRKKNPIGRFKQEDFINLLPGDKYYEEKHNYKICSITTLSSIENGSKVAREPIYAMLLDKVDAIYVYRESNIKSQDYLCQGLVDLFFHSYSNCPLYRKEFQFISESIKNDCLWTVDCIAIESIMKWFDYDVSLSRVKFDYLMSLYPCLHSNVKHILLYYFAYSSYFNPELWSSLSKVRELISQREFNDDYLQSFCHLNLVYHFSLTKTFHERLSTINESSYLFRIFEKFKAVTQLNDMRHVLTQDQLLDRLDQIFSTNNMQFKKSLNRVYLSNKYIQNDARFLYLEFLVFEPFPFSFSKLIFNRTYSKIFCVNKMREFIGWNSVNYF